MIKKMEIKNYKCFRNLEVEVAPLTVLSGINSVGKSSFIQSLLLMRQSVLGSTDSALLNGELVNLGYSDDVFYEYANEGEGLGFCLYEDASIAELEFQYENKKRVLFSEKPYDEELKNISLFSDEFYYLEAERIGPRTAFSSSDDNKQKLNAIGNKGEYSAWLLAEYERSKIVNKKLLHPSQEIDELRAQVEAWFSEIGQSPRIHLNKHVSMELVSLQFSFLRNGIPSQHYRPTNVGFGLTYALPIFVAGLSIKPGGTLIIENPEAHLHPKGQLAMGKFLSQVAASGVQVFIETHSDHLLNGIRIAAKKKIISPELVAMLFFHRDEQDLSAIATCPELDADGRLNIWPEDFFDEWENSLAELL